MASRGSPSSRLPPGVTVSKRMGVVLAMAINTSAMRTRADLMKQIPPNVIDAFLRIPPRESRNFWKWENSGETKLAIPFETDEEMKDIARKLEASNLAYRKFYFGGKRSRLSMISIFGREEDIERVIGRWGWSKWDKMDASSDYSDGEDTSSESEDEDKPRGSEDYDMTFIVNCSLRLPYLLLAEEVATAALGLYRCVNDEEREKNKHYIKWDDDYRKIDDAYGAVNNTQLNVLRRESRLHDVHLFGTVAAQNGKTQTSIVGLFGRKTALKPLLRHLTKL